MKPPHQSTLLIARWTDDDPSPDAALNLLRNDNR
ncbi:hypothetical protein EYZ11_000442 [Aspergillus tanneri]|uniref:Uncharacterized protein n=1 Tax=Aspergillus tanneri TaxID=1220188 RepID=A0A4S3JX69_9EURO|nr:hypothetical protein EYZ11_000442 [Aspergillus tanneri]